MKMTFTLNKTLFCEFIRKRLQLLTTIKAIANEI